MIRFLTSQQVPQRLTIREDNRIKIKRFGINNVYPQLMIELLEKSGNTVKAINTKAKFLRGEGFENEPLNYEVFNKYGDTGSDLLNNIAYQLALFNGFAIHINYNALFQIDSLEVIPYQFCRIGIDEMEGKIAVFNNWGGEYFKRIAESVQYIDVFNPDIQVIKKQVEEAGSFEDYKGQIYYYTPVKNSYPKVTFDAVRENVESDYRIMNWKKNGIKNGFAAYTVVEYPGQFESDQERNQFSKALQSSSGDEAAGTFIVLENNSIDAQGNHMPIKFTPVQIQNVDTIFNSTLNDIKDSIRSIYLIPPVLMGESNTGLFNQEQMADSYTYYNEMTKQERNIISNVFDKLMPYYKISFEDNYDILVQQFGDSIDEEENDIITEND